MRGRSGWRNNLIESVMGRDGRPDLVRNPWREAWREARVVKHGAGGVAGAKDGAI